MNSFQLVVGVKVGKQGVKLSKQGVKVSKQGRHSIPFHARLLENKKQR